MPGSPGFPRATGDNGDIFKVLKIYPAKFLFNFEGIIIFSGILSIKKLVTEPHIEKNVGKSPQIRKKTKSRRWY